MKTNNNKTIAILGGMGPDASARLYQLLISMARDEFKARKNHEYPEILLYSIPVPDFISNDNQISLAKQMLIHRLTNLSHLNPSYICIACNTVHILIDDLKLHTSAEFISIPEIVTQTVLKSGYSKVCLLATPSTIKYRIYQELFDQHGIESTYPQKEQLFQLGDIINHIVSGNITGIENKLVELADSIKADSQALVLGCTELPLAFPHRYSIPVLDSTQILARALLTRYYMM